VQPHDRLAFGLVARDAAAAVGGATTNQFKRVTEEILPALG